MDKRLLLQYCDITQEILSLRQRREVILAALQAPPVVDGQPRGRGQSDPTQNAAIALADLAADIDSRIADLCAVERQIEDSIAALPPKYRRLMRHRYLDGLTWPRVTEKIYGQRDDFLDHFESYLRRVFRDHWQALRLLR